MDELLNHLTPITLATICAEIRDAREISILSDNAKLQSIAIWQMGENLVGKEDFSKMVEEAAI